MDTAHYVNTAYDASYGVKSINGTMALPFTEQSAIEIVMNEPRFSNNVQIVPQEWFNAYLNGTPTEFEEEMDDEGLQDYHARREDFRLHFAGFPEKDKLINEWVKSLQWTIGVWKT